MPIDRGAVEGDLVRAVELLAEVFSARSVTYALIGGLATTLRGRPRFTQDVDVLLRVPQVELPALLDELVARGFTLDAQKVMREYVQEHMTQFRFGFVRVDWLKPLLPLYDQALARAAALPWTENHDVRVATPEALILMKMVSFRAQDQADIETLLAANQHEIDRDLILRSWSDVAAGEEARTAWLEKCLARRQPEGPASG